MLALALVEEAKWSLGGVCSRVISKNLKLGGGIDKCWVGVNIRETQIYIKNHKKQKKIRLVGGVLSLNWRGGYFPPVGGCTNITGL